MASSPSRAETKRRRKDGLQKLIGLGGASDSSLKKITDFVQSE